MMVRHGRAENVAGAAMKKRSALTIGIAVSFSAYATNSATAGVFTDDFARCLVNKATEDDRLAFMSWMFSAISADPQLRPMTSLDDAQRRAIANRAAATFQRLAITDCRSEAIAAVKNEGAQSFYNAFGALGEAATQQMFNSPEAQAELQSLGEGFDAEQMKAFAEEAGIPPLSQED